MVFEKRGHARGSRSNEADHDVHPTTDGGTGMCKVCKFSKQRGNARSLPDVPAPISNIYYY
jgi:hypothetical protein